MRPGRPGLILFLPRGTLNGAPGVGAVPYVRWKLYSGLVALLALVLVAAGALASTPQVETALRSGLLIPSLLGKAPLDPLAFFTPDPQHGELAFEAAGLRLRAQVYRPDDGGRHGAVVIAMGARPWAPDDPRLVRMATAMARSGVVVMTFRPPYLQADDIRPEEIEVLIAAFGALRSQPYVDPGRVGFLGISVGGSLALLAASDPRIAADVNFVVSLGAYYDVFQLIGEIARRRVCGSDGCSAWVPDPVTVAVVRKHLIDTLEDAAERQLLSDLFLRHRPVPEERLNALGRHGRAVYQMLANEDPDRVDERLAALPSETLGGFREISPSHLRGPVSAAVYVIHDRRDVHIPPIHGDQLVQALRAAGTDVRYVQFSTIQHVDPASRRDGFGTLGDALNLYVVLYRVMLRLT